MTWTERDQAEFDAGLDAYQARQAEDAHEAALRSYEAAARPDAVPLEVTFADLRVGDYMTNEGPSGRWVRIAELRGPACNVKHRALRKPAYGEVSVLFEIPEPVTVSGETRYWIERQLTDSITVDARARG